MYIEPSVGSSICDFSQVSDYPGVAFSKQRSEATITKEGGIIKGEGITLSVPPGAVSEGDEVTILLQACIGGPFCLPPKPGDLNFISPVYLIQPPFAFRKNVTLSINTFVKFYQNYDNKSFCFVTSPTQKTFNEDFEPQWVFRKFGSPDFNEEHDGRIRGSINLKHFCFGGFAGSGKAILIMIKCVQCYTNYNMQFQERSFPIVTACTHLIFSALR